jgi:hypothetical protein
VGDVTEAPPAALVLGRLADERRLRALSAVVLGARTVGEVAARAGISDNEAARALAQLVGAQIVATRDSGLEVDRTAFARAARAISSPHLQPTFDGATPEQAAVLRNFAGADGRIRSLPAREAKRRQVLEYVAGRFEPGREYPEREVNGILAQVYDDFVSLRRFLVDEDLLAREAGVYQRTVSGAP